MNVLDDRKADLAGKNKIHCCCLLYLAIYMYTGNKPTQCILLFNVELFMNIYGSQGWFYHCSSAITEPEVSPEELLLSPQSVTG